MSTDPEFEDSAPEEETAADLFAPPRPPRKVGKDWLEAMRAEHEWLRRSGTPERRTG